MNKVLNFINLYRAKIHITKTKKINNQSVNRTSNKISLKRFRVKICSNNKVLTYFYKVTKILMTINEL